MRAAMGSIQRLGKDHYRVSMEGASKDGKRTRVTKVVRGSRDEAEMELARMKIDSGKDEFLFDNKTFSQYWNTMYALQFESYSKGNVKNLKSSYKLYLKPKFGCLKMCEITKRIVETKLMEIDKPYAREAAFKAMRQCFNYAYGEGDISDNPFLRKIKVKHPRKTEQPAMDSEELSEWMNKIRGYRFEAAALIAVSGGLRREEVVPLEWEDMNFDEDEDGLWCYVPVRTAVTVYEQKETKTERSTRTVVIAEPFSTRLKELEGTGYLVSRLKDGKMANPQTFYRTYVDWCNTHGIEYIALRNLRTTYATILHSRPEVKGTTVSRSLGHTKLDIDYAHYFMVNESDYRAAAKALGESVSNIL